MNERGDRLFVTAIIAACAALAVLAFLVRVITDASDRWRERLPQPSPPKTESELRPPPPQGDALWAQMTDPARMKELRARMHREDI